MAIHIHDVQQGTQEWLDLRSNKITCSNALLLLEKGPRACLATNVDAAERITPNGNFYAERGHALEADIREAFEQELSPNGLELIETGMITNDKYPLAGYSPDGLVVLKNSPADKFQAIVEIKAYNDYVKHKNSDGSLSAVYVGKHARACESYDNVPLEARVQIQMELLISEAPVCYLVLTNPDADANTPKVKIYTVEPDVKIQSRLIEKLLNTKE